MKRLLAFTASIILMSITATAQSVYADYNRTVDFSRFHTYAWGQQQNPNQIANSLLAQEAYRQINAQLQGRGLQMVTEPQKPDLIVVASGGMKVQTSYNAWGMGGWRFGGGYATVTPEQSVVGTLVVDLYDASAKQLVWRGMAQDTLNESKPEKNMQKLDKGIAKIFKKYPWPPNKK